MLFNVLKIIRLVKILLCSLPIVFICWIHSWASELYLLVCYSRSNSWFFFNRYLLCVVFASLNKGHASDYLEIFCSERFVIQFCFPFKDWLNLKFCFDRLSKVCFIIIIVWRSKGVVIYISVALSNFSILNIDFNIVLRSQVKCLLWKTMFAATFFRFWVKEVSKNVRMSKYIIKWNIKFKFKYCKSRLKQ